tara:strand:+ start:1171 stop:1335 length:165 start_codon:yes stop_codon:yes gene_type:complete
MSYLLKHKTVIKVIDLGFSLWQKAHNWFTKKLTGDPTPQYLSGKGKSQNDKDEV